MAKQLIIVVLVVLDVGMSQLHREYRAGTGFRGEGKAGADLSSEPAGCGGGCSRQKEPVEEMHCRSAVMTCTRMRVC